MAEVNITAEETGPEAPTEEPQVEEKASNESLAIEDKFHVPDKFMNKDGTVNVEGLAKSYAELEKRHSGTEKADTEVPAPSNTETFTAAEVSEMQKEMAEEGELSEKTIDILKSRGMPEAMAKDYLAGQKLIAEQMNEKIMAPVGGEENYQELLQWAGENLTQEDIESYDKIMLEGDMNQKLLAVEGLAARRGRRNPTAPKTILGSTSDVQTSNAFGSWDQVKRAMRDPRYATDEAYRDDVTQRLSMSNF